MKNTCSGTGADVEAILVHKSQSVDTARHQNDSKGLLEHARCSVKELARQMPLAKTSMIEVT